MFQLRLIMILMLTFFCEFVVAVDGYKNVKFGSTIAQVRTTKICNLNLLTVESAVETYACADFKFGGKDTNALFFFVEKKLLRIGIVAAADDTNDVVAIAESLRVKYGAPSTPYDSERMTAFMNGTEDNFDLAFDKDTVALRLIRNNGARSTNLIYSSINYDEAIKAAKKRSIASDL